MAGGLCIRREGVVQELVDGMGRLVAQLGESAIAGEAGGVAHETAEAGVVGVLIFDQGRREHQRRAMTAEQSREAQRVRGADLEAGVSVELDKFERGAEQRSGAFGLGDALGGSAVAAGLATRADDEVGRAAGACFEGDNGADSKLDVIGVGSENEERAQG